MKDKIYMYPGYNSNHDLKAVEIQHTAVFGLTGRGKTTYLKNLLDGVKEHNDRDIQVNYADGTHMSKDEFIEYLTAIKDIVEERINWLRNKRVPCSIQSLIREEKECPYEEVVFCIDDYRDSVLPCTDETSLLVYILTYGKLVGIHLFMSFAISSRVCTDVLIHFVYRACLDSSKETLVTVIGSDISEVFTEDKRIVAFRDKGMITRNYDIYTVKNCNKE